MPVSPQDFELYSRMTGTPLPSDAMSRMQMAPEVFQFTKNFAKRPNIVEKTGNLIKSAAKNTLAGMGVLASMDLENQERQRQELMRNEAAKEQVADANMDESPEQVAPTPELTAVEKGELAKQKTVKVKTDEMIRLEQARAKLRNIADEKSGPKPIGKTPDGQLLYDAADLDTQEPTTADSYGQDYIPNQSASNIVDRSIDLGSEMADESPTVASELSQSQDSQPYDSKLGFQEDPMQEKKLPEVTELLGKVPSQKKVAAFFTRLGLDDALLGAGQSRDETVELIGDDSPLNDNVDSELDGGEDQSGVPTQKNIKARGQNTSATTDLSSHHKEMRKLDALERTAEQSPSTKQIALNEMNKSREGFMAQDGPNKPAYDAKQRILKKTAEKRKQIENTKGPSIVFMNAGSGESKEVPISDVNSVEDVKNMTKEVMSPSVNQKSDDFMAKFVEGSQSDIGRGRRGNRSLGITRIPATNGDAQVGFVLANKPLDKSPTTATTYGFGVAPGAEGLLDNQLNQESFSDYMQRGLGEAKEGKKRKAGEIFEFLPPSARVVSGTARLGDIVM